MVEVEDNLRREGREELPLITVGSPFVQEAAEAIREEAGEVTPPPLLTTSSDAKVGGRLRNFAAAWVGDRWARSIVAHGLRWRWKQRPALRNLIPQNASPTLVKYVGEMVDKGVVVPFNG